MEPDRAGGPEFTFPRGFIALWSCLWGTFGHQPQRRRGVASVDGSCRWSHYGCLLDVWLLWTRCLRLKNVAFSGVLPGSFNVWNLSAASKARFGQELEELTILKLAEDDSQMAQRWSLPGVTLFFVLAYYNHTFLLPRFLHVYPPNKLSSASVWPRVLRFDHGLLLGHIAVLVCDVAQSMPNSKDSSSQVH